MTIKEVLENKVDVKAGKLPYGVYLEIREIVITKDKDDAKAVVSIFKALHEGFELSSHDFLNLKLQKYFEEICNGIIHWLTMESEMLAYTPTDAQLRAGIKELSEKVGDFGTVKALAKQFNKDPDEILKEWDYAKVFLILYSDLEEYKYQEKYNKIITST